MKSYIERRHGIEGCSGQGKYRKETKDGVQGKYRKETQNGGVQRAREIQKGDTEWRGAVGKGNKKKGDRMEGWWAREM